jgi:hypothetical protein
MPKLSEMNQDARKQALNSMWSEIKSESVATAPEAGTDPLNPQWSINFGCDAIED